MKTDDYHILITGTARGLGLYLCECFLEQNHCVYALLRKDSAGISSLKKKYANRFYTYKADVRDERELGQVFTQIKTKTSGIDILINNAAVHLDSHRPDFEEIDFSVYAPTFEVNAVAPLKVVRRFLPLVKSGRRKLIVNITSEAGSIANAWRQSEYAYCMSKAALNMTSKILQNRLEKEGIKVLAVHPGWFSSDMGGKEAPVTPKQAAIKVTQTVLKDWHGKNAIYIDSEGKEMPW